MFVSTSIKLMDQYVGRTTHATCSMAQLPALTDALFSITSLDNVSILQVQTGYTHGECAS